MKAGRLPDFGGDNLTATNAMRRFFACLIALFVMGLPARAQTDKPAPQQKDQDQTNRPTLQRPTLGPPTTAAPGGPHSSTTNDPRKLLHIRKIFVESIDNMLSDKLMEDLTKAGRFRIVADKKEADAVMRGTCFDSRRLKSLHSEVFINDPITGGSIWQDDVHRPFNPPVLQKAVDDTAAMIIEHLNDDVELAQRK